MAKNRLINPFSKVNNDTGFGTNASYGGRFINRDGTFNVRKEGQGFWQRFSVFHTMLISLFFIAVNLVYTMIYLMLGTDQFIGMIANDRWAEIKEVY